VIHGLERLYRPPRLGVIRLGVKVAHGEGKEIPREVDYFVLPPELVPAFGEKPRELRNVRLPFDDPAKNLHSMYYEKRAGRLLTLRCDGLECVEIPVEGPERASDCRRDQDDIWKACECGARARAKLSIVVPGTRVGLWEVGIGGLRRIADLMAELEMYRLQFGRLTGIPFDLERQKAEENYRKADGARAARTGYPVRLRCPLTGAQAALVAGSDVDLKALAATATAVPGKVVVMAGEPAPPVAAAPEPAEAPPQHVEGDEIPDEDAPDEWDISMCFRAAAGIGVSATMYERYLQGQYGRRSGDTTDEDVRREQSRLAKPGDGQAVKRLVAEMAMVASGGRRGA
jgi:hypothetical protein